MRQFFSVSVFVFVLLMSSFAQAGTAAECAQLKSMEKVIKTALADARKNYSKVQSAKADAQKKIAAAKNAKALWSKTRSSVHYNAFVTAKAAALRAIATYKTQAAVMQSKARRVKSLITQMKSYAARIGSCKSSSGNQRSARTTAQNVSVKVERIVKVMVQNSPTNPLGFEGNF